MLLMDQNGAMQINEVPAETHAVLGQRAGPRPMPGAASRCSGPGVAKASFDPRNYGYGKLIDLIEATELFEVKRQNLIVLIRDKRKA